MLEAEIARPAAGKLEEEEEEEEVVGGSWGEKETWFFEEDP